MGDVVPMPPKLPEISWWCSSCGETLAPAPIASPISPCPKCSSTSRQSWSPLVSGSFGYGSGLNWPQSS